MYQVKFGLSSQGQYPAATLSQIKYKDSEDKEWIMGTWKLL